MSVGRKALFRLSQNLSHPIRRQVIDKAKDHFQKRWVDPLDFKLMGFVTETKSLEIIPECLNCGNKYLHYGFMDYLLDKWEKSWRDIECKKCNQFIVEIKSTKVKYPKKLYGGCYKSYQRMKVKPYLLVFPYLRMGSDGKYLHGKPTLYQAGFYKVNPRGNGKSIITFS